MGGEDEGYLTSPPCLHYSVTSLLSVCLKHARPSKQVCYSTCGPTCSIRGICFSRVISNCLHLETIPRSPLQTLLILCPKAPSALVLMLFSCSLSQCPFPASPSVPGFLFQTLLLTYFILPQTQLPSLDLFILGTGNANGLS